MVERPMSDRAPGAVVAHDCPQIRLLGVRDEAGHHCTLERRRFTLGERAETTGHLRAEPCEERIVRRLRDAQRADGRDVVVRNVWSGRASTTDRDERDERYG
jgi:hypothetical protein